MEWDGMEWNAISAVNCSYLYGLVNLHVIFEKYILSLVVRTSNSISLEVYCVEFLSFSAEESLD